MTGLFFVGLLGGNLEFWFDVSVFCVFKETSYGKSHGFFSLEVTREKCIMLP